MLLRFLLKASLRLTARSTFRSTSARYGFMALGFFVACGLGWKAHAQSLTWENTETLFKHVIDVFPEEAATAHNNLGNVYRRQNKLPEAIEEFKKGLALRENARIRSNLAATYTNLGEYDLALDSYQKAKAFDPVNELPDFGLGILYAKIGKTQQALDAYAESLKKNPHYVAALLNRGSLYSDLGRYEEAEKDFRAAIEIEPLFSQAYFNLGVILQKQGKWEEAAAAYQDAVDAEPRYIDARMSLGIALAKLAKLPEAKSQFLEVLKLQPGNSSAVNAIERIDAAMGQ
jgi:tetratricopeptide (TPR) repeat protein